MKAPLLPFLSTSLLSVVLAACAAGGSAMDIGMPLDRAQERPTPLHFGVHVTPEENPIIPAERFSGYHAALDFEILPNEIGKDVPVYAICNGKILVSTSADGYGGVVVQNCRWKGKNVTVLYGHTDPASQKPVGAAVKQGDQIAILGEGRSAESDGNRKHLHLSVHEGKEVQMLGYVQSQNELGNYLNPADILGIDVTDEPFHVLE